MLGRKSLLGYANNLLGGVLGAAALYFVGRYIDPRSVGMAAFALSAAGLASFALTLGLEQAHVKRISEGRPLADCIRTYHTLRLALVAAGCLVATVAVVAWDQLRGFHDATTLPVMLVGVAYLGVYSLRSMVVDTFNALQQAAKAQVVLLAEAISRSPAQILAALLVAAGAGAGGAAALLRRLGAGQRIGVEQGALLFGGAVVVGGLVSLAVAMVIFRRSAFGPGRFDPALARSYMAFAAPLALFGPIWTVATEVDALLIGYFWDAAEVGYYYAAKRVILLVTAVPAAVAVVFFPLISSLAARGDAGEVRLLARSTLRNLSLVVSLLAMFLIAFAEEGIHVFLSDAYLPAAPILRLLALYAVVASFGLVFGAMVRGLGRPWSLVGVGMLAVGGNLLLNLALIPSSLLGVDLFGLKGTGAALATLLAEVAATSLLYFMIPKASRGLPWSSMARHGVAAVGVGLLLRAMLPLPWLGHADRVWDLMAIAALGTLLYTTALWALREVGRRDWVVVRDLISPGKMADYVREEVGQRP